MILSGRTILHNRKQRGVFPNEQDELRRRTQEEAARRKKKDEEAELQRRMVEAVKAFKKAPLFSPDEAEFYHKLMQQTNTGEVTIAKVEVLYKKNSRARKAYRPCPLGFDLAEILSNFQEKRVLDEQQLLDILNSLVEDIRVAWAAFREANRNVKHNVQEAGANGYPSDFIAIVTFQRERKEAFRKSVQDAVKVLPVLESRISELQFLQSQLNSANDFMADKGWYAPQPERGSKEQMYNDALVALRRWSEETAAEPIVHATEDALRVSREALRLIMLDVKAKDHGMDSIQMIPDLGRTFAILCECLEVEDQFWRDVNPLAVLPVHHIRWAAILLRQDIADELQELHRFKRAIYKGQEDMVAKNETGATARPTHLNHLT